MTKPNECIVGHLLPADFSNWKVDVIFSHSNLDHCTTYLDNFDTSIDTGICTGAFKDNIGKASAQQFLNIIRKFLCLVGWELCGIKSVSGTKIFGSFQFILKDINKYDITCSEGASNGAG